MASAASAAGAAAAGTARPGSPSVLYLSLNQDQTCLAVGTTHGFNIFSLDPLKERFHKGLFPLCSIPSCCFHVLTHALLVQNGAWVLGLLRCSCAATFLRSSEAACCPSSPRTSSSYGTTSKTRFVSYLVSIRVSATLTCIFSCCIGDCRARVQQRRERCQAASRDVCAF